MYVYILECDNHHYYTGIAKDLQKRLTNHCRGSKYTRANKPIKLVYVEESLTAHKREAEIKKLTRKQKELLIQANINLLENYEHITVS